MIYRFSSFIVIGFIIYACNNSNRESVVKRDTTINIVTSFNNLFLDSVKLQHFLHRNKQFENFKKQFEDFYRQRNYEYAWFDSSGPGEQASHFINLLNNTIRNLRDSNLYNQQLYALYNRFSDTGTKHREDEVLNTELFLTGQFFNYANQMYRGTDSDVAALGWFIPRKKVDLTALLDSVIITNKEAEEFAPLNDQYKKLQSFIPGYFQLQKRDWDSIPKPLQALHEGERNKIIRAVKKRLAKLGDFDVKDSSSVYDTALLLAVKTFQKRMGIGADGVIGAQMLDELNVTPAQRIQQILVNLERMRWMPPENDSSRRIFVNIPEYKMYVYDSGMLSFTMNVIVGTAANSTVIFSGNLKYIVFSPYWKVPPKIVRTEILPAMKRDTGYMRRNNMERTGGPDTLPSIRQKPGPGNSLGQVKFLFPNNYDIYFHDTPNRELFSASNRSFSHGCIRVGDPKHLAQFLLQNDTTWNDLRIDTSMNSKKEIWAALQKPVPVVIGYFTAWVDRNGLLNFRKDIYGHDERLADKLFLKQ